LTHNNLKCYTTFYGTSDGCKSNKNSILMIRLKLEVTGNN